jgi:hypothetical protein
MRSKVLALVSTVCICLVGGSLRAAAPQHGSSPDETRLGLTSGAVNLALDVQAMKDLGVTFEKAAHGSGTVNILLQVDTDASSFQMSRNEGKYESMFGMLTTHGGGIWNVSSNGRTEKANVGDLLIGFGGRYGTISDSRDLHTAILELVPETVAVNYDSNTTHLIITAEVKVAGQFMLGILGTEHGIGNTIGKITIEGLAAVASGSRSEDEAGGERAAGPDVTVGELRGTSGDVPGGAPMNWGTASGYVGYSAGTTSCNVGTTPLNWIDGGPNHPVIGQALYRYTPAPVGGASKIEMVGQSWLKHGFCALQGTVCLSCSQFCGGCCDHLGVGCSDPYSANRNGGRGGMGAKGPINAATGVNDYGANANSYPFKTAPTDDVTTGRLRVLQGDVNPATNAGALYYYEGQYVAADDATSGNKNNNASYRRCTIGAAPSFSMAWASTASGQTVRQTQAIKAWGVNDPQVTYVNVDVDGRFTMGYRVTDLSGIGNGPWHYEYAVQNMNSDRAASSFVVPCPSGVSVTNTGFKDVDYYKDGLVYGTAYDGTDWPVSAGGGFVAWEMVTASPADNSNALRWGTMYNFRFDANSPPVAGTISMDLFKAGSPHGIDFAALVPSAIAIPCACPGDLNASNTIDGDDILPFTAMYMAQIPVSSCADVAAPNGGALDDSDVNGFVDLLVNGSNVCK